jgi:glycosyltransferase involved in cell wall biosynthesis
MMLSVIMPVYNGEVYIKEAIESIVAQREITISIEIIIVDDGSTDTTREIIHAFRNSNINYIYQPNSGPSKARNTGIRHAQGELIAFLDADDCWPLTKLKHQLSFLEENPNVDVAGGLIDYVYMPGSEYRKEQIKIDTPVFNVQLGGLIVRKKVFDSVGCFNEQLRFSEDQDWILRVKESGITMSILNEIVLLYRIHPGNVTIHKTLKDLGVLRALKLSLDRRRQHTTDPLNPGIDEGKD